MAQSQTYFQNAHHFEVNDGHFFNISNTKRVVIKNATNNDPVSTILWQHVAAGAMFDSAERYPPGKCHPGTREKVSNKIVDWMDDLDPDKRILWLYGPAGSGKSAICQSLCERLSKVDLGRFGGSFFFAKGLTDRGNSLKLFATLSYQLAIHFPSMRREINEALHRDPSLPTKSMDVQLFSLIIQPLMRCQPFPAHSPTLIIDGLDECADDQGMDIQRNIITLISQSLADHNVPLRFMIASRPEFWIRDAFETAPLPNLTLSISLRDDEDTDEDIKAYLTDEFEKIRLDNKRTMGSVTPPWPHANIIDRFVYEASGQFIYASTIVKFVGKSSRFSDPQEQLRILTTPGPHRASAFSELDRLYATILSAYPRWPTMKRVLGGILVDANATILETVLGVNPNEITLVSDALSALVNVKRPKPLSKYEILLEPIFGSLIAGQETMDLCHLSFREFLEDETRSGPFYVDTRETIAEITETFFGIIHRNLDDNYTRAPHFSLNIGIASYRCMMLVMSSALVQNLYNASLVSWVTHVTQKLSLSPDVKLDHIGCFLWDIDLMLGSWSEHEAQDDDLANAIRGFESVAHASRKRHIQRLASSKQFKVTRPLAYLSEPRTVDQIFTTIPQDSEFDVLSTFQECCHLIDLFYSLGDGVDQSPWYAFTVNLHDTHLGWDDDSEDEGWLTCGEWRDHRIAIVSQDLQRISIGVDSIKETESTYFNVGRFFQSRNLSDIHSSSYFENGCNISIFAFMANFSAWTDHLPCPEPYSHSWDVPLFAGLISHMLCWFNRQLTNPNTLSILEHQDNNLVSTMRATMKQIFQNQFLPIYRRPYCDYFEIDVTTLFTDSHYTIAMQDESVKLKVFPLTQSQKFQEGKTPFIEHGVRYPPGWRPFHNELFRKKLPTRLVDPFATHMIEPQDWHPYLTSHLLAFLTADLYRRSKPGLKPNPSAEKESKESFSCLVQCLPFAETTQQNLDALRAITYLFPKAALKWDPPLDFWTLSLEFLKKYDRSILSYEELQLFEQWMDNIRLDALGRNQQ